MKARSRLITAAALTVLLLGGAAAFGVNSFAAYRQRQAAPSEVPTTTYVAGDRAPRIVFRNTARGQGYGLVATVPLPDPGGARAVSGVPCDRVYATNEEQMCLRINRGVVTTFSASLLDPNGHVQRSWPLPGLPSRTRISPDSRLVAFTAFVTGASYGTVGFSTMTQISAVGGADSGSLEGFALSVGGTRVTAADLNIWGVTFTSDDNVFYATAASAGRTWLVRGDRATRTLTAVRETAECPSVSPDGTHIAYKKNVSSSGTPSWAIAVLDLAPNTETLLPEKRSVDDQVEWLDNSTVLYGLLRENAPGDSDVWSAPIDGRSKPRVFIEHAWSPSVVRK